MVMGGGSGEYEGWVEEVENTKGGHRPD